MRFRGALLAECDWLCFVDADVRAGPQLVAAAVTTAEAQGIDMLSVHPLQELGSFWKRMIMPAGLLVLACAKSLEAGAPGPRAPPLMSMTLTFEAIHPSSFA